MKVRLFAAAACATLSLSPRVYAQAAPLTAAAVAVGDWLFSPTLELRTRGEYRRDPVDMGGVDLAGDSSARVRNAYGVLERTRLGLGAEHGPLEAQVTLEDARAWGVPAPSGILGAQPSAGASIGLYEAWFEAKTGGARPSFVRVGRQPITWGDGRLLSNADGSPVGRTLDAIRARWTGAAFDLEAFAAVLDAPSPLGPSANETLGPTVTGTELYGAQLALPVDPLLRVEASLLARVARSGSLGDGSRFALARADGELYVGDLRVSGDQGGWRYAVEGAYELGRATYLSDAGVAAWAAAAYVERRIDELRLSPTFRLEASYASGDDGGTGTYRQFDPLLPDVHPLSGAMDVFSGSNAAQVAARASIEPWADVRARAEYRYARLANRSGEWLDSYLVGVGRAATDAELGHEIDAAIGWTPWPALEVEAGYGLFLFGDGARSILAAEQRGAAGPSGAITPADLSQFGYLEATLRAP